MCVSIKKNGDKLKAHYNEKAVLWYKNKMKSYPAVNEWARFRIWM